MKVYFVGFGPGNVELLTLKAYKLLKEADLIIYPGSIIDEDFLREFKAEKVNSHGMSLEEITETIERNLRKGRKVVRVQSGDPSIFGSVWEQIRELRKRGIECEIIPGVSSVFASASSLGIELTSPLTEGVAIVRPSGKTLKKDHLDELARLPLTLVILLGVDRIEYIAEKIAGVRGWDEPCAVVFHASRKDEVRIVSNLGKIADEVRKRGIKRTATIIVGKVVEGYNERSYLYS
ncbi:cobalt-precorrin-4/precorrin-4 C(11)-methyltransferase [Archaeoglobus neptunius]|uniref:cobalt-precorrin-4/precorrin-4 C(11)-methyltransferase n=1 Tax=Archaeoglobus neptunius TaxID=2798580 RepID=UPI001926EE6D|nr:SAM-dependent methyltransferase [Archaeoglobus neptunius]